MKNNKNQYRQGDVLLRRIDKIPANKKQTKPTLALGETTGHHHTFEGGATCYADDEVSLAEFVRVDEALANLTHQEHATIPIPKGNYEKLYQVEDTSREITRVAD
jgi:hypothetical protein